MFSIINWKLAARVVVSLGLLGWFVFSIEWHEIGRAVSGMNYFWLLAAVLWVILAVVVSVIKWRIILLAQGIKLAWRELWRIYWAGLFFNNFLPSSIGGDALRILWVGKSAGDAAGAAASVVTERILATTGLALVGIMAALCVSSGRSGILMLFVALLLVTVILLAVLMSGWLPALLKNRENRITCFLYNLSCHGRRIRKKPGAIVSALFWSVVFQICVVAVNFCVFNGLKLFQINWMDSMYVIPAVSVAAMLPLGINGYGLREGAYISLLSPYGVSAADAFASSIIFAFVISLCSLWGGWVWICRRRKGERTMLNLQASKIAEQAMKKGSNCCEAVLIAASTVWGLNLDEDILASALFFEEGMNSGCTCGALIGMIMASGIMHKKSGHPLGRKLPRHLHDRFKEEFGSTCCRVIQSKRPLLQKMRSKAACIALTSRAAAMLVEEWEGTRDGQNTGVCYNSDSK